MHSVHETWVYTHSDGSDALFRKPAVAEGARPDGVAGPADGGWHRDLCKECRNALYDALCTFMGEPVRANPYFFTTDGRHL